MENRTKHTYQTTIYSFAKNVLVVCPKCKGKALVKTSNFDTFIARLKDAKNARLVCVNCGLAKTRGESAGELSHFILGGAIDPFFHLPVWLQADFSGEILWAYNLEHLDFLAEHVGSKLRERNTAKNQNNSLGSRLPRWMTASGNREAVLREIEKLKEK